MQCLKKFFHTLQNKSQCCSRINWICKHENIVALNFFCRFKHDFNTQFEDYGENEEEKERYTKLSQDYLGTVIDGHRVFIIQPYVKWGVNKNRYTTPQLQLAEATALINTLPNWKVVGTKIVPLLTLQRKQLVGSGSLEILKKEIQNCQHATAIFVSTNLLRFIQISELQKVFHLPIYDRYSIVIHIFREHAKTTEAKLQVALAEIPYIKKKIIDLSDSRAKRINFDERSKKILESRERKLRNALQDLKEHRKMIKRQRCSYGFPSIAVVGYTNAGKTSLIKALTGDASLQPKDELFATLDTTVHQGFLPNKLKVLYVDTIGFIQDVPETLIQPFTVTLEDAMDADILIHVYDIGHPDVKAQIQHVQKTIQPMISENKLVINVANKCDISEKDILEEEAMQENTFIVSATKLIGIDLLRLKIEEEIIKAAKLVNLNIRVKVGGPTQAWLYKETTVTNAVPDSNDSEYLIMNVIMSTSVFYRMKRLYKK